MGQDHAISWATAGLHNGRCPSPVALELSPTRPLGHPDRFEEPTHSRSAPWRFSTPMALGL